WAHLPDDLAAELRQPPPAAAGLRGEPDTDLRQQTRAAVAAAVQASAGNLSEAARRLGISRNTLYRQLAAERAESGRP
ncbi:MAG: helix-turn-helix domain-containing protein, partial [Rubrivivax sp.]